MQRPRVYCHECGDYHDRACPPRDVLYNRAEAVRGDRPCGEHSFRQLQVKYAQIRIYSVSSLDTTDNRQ